MQIWCEVVLTSVVDSIYDYIASSAQLQWDRVWQKRKEELEDKRET